jgi:hypothetical protein
MTHHQLTSLIASSLPDFLWRAFQVDFCEATSSMQALRRLLLHFEKKEELPLIGPNSEG